MCLCFLVGLFFGQEKIRLPFPFLWQRQSTGQRSMHALRKFGCKVFCSSLILVVLHILSFFCDKKSDIKISTDPVQRQRTKHLKIQMHYTRELVHDTTIVLQYCPTDEQIAEIFTKNFTEKKFTYLHSLLGVISSR